MKPTRFIGLLSVLFVSNTMLSQAQVVLDNASGSHSYTQDFNTLPNSGAITWTDNSTLSGWYANATTITATSGSNGSFLGSFGATGATERALGANPGGINKAWGVRLQNTGTTAITIDTISFTGEQWFNGGSGLAQTVAFAYLLSATPITNLSSSGYVALTGLNFTGPVTSTTSSSLNGNLVANQAALSLGSLNITLAPGTEVMFRWFYPDGVGPDANLAVDNFSLSYSTVAIPEPSTWGLLLVGLSGLLYFRHRRCVR